MIVAHILAAGSSPMMAQTIGGSGATGLIATGASQADALQLPASQNVFSVASGAGGAKLPKCEQGNEIWFRNDSGNNITVYPFEPAGVVIAPAVASLIVPSGKTVVFKAVSGSVWLSLIGA